MLVTPPATRRRWVAGVAVLATLGLGTPLAALIAPADAGTTTTCKAWKTKIERTGLDPNYASARCTAIADGIKVRAKLDVNLDADRHSSWFVRTHRTLSTSTTNCVWGCSATYEKQKR